jgi:hypothetical protein
MRSRTRPHVRRATDAAIRTGRAADEDELARWAAFLAVDAAPHSARKKAVCALVDAADGRAEPLHRAWILTLERLARGQATRREVGLVKSALDAVRGVAA